MATKSWHRVAIKDEYRVAGFDAWLRLMPGGSLELAVYHYQNSERHEVFRSVCPDGAPITRANQLIEDYIKVVRGRPLTMDELLRKLEG